MAISAPVPGEFRRTVRVDQLGHDEQEFRFVASADERAALAERYGVVSLDRLDETVDAVRRAAAKGAKVYWVCPLIDETEDSDQAADEAAGRASNKRPPLGSAW